MLTDIDSLRTSTAPLRHKAFRRLWLADQVANIGVFTQAVGTAWILVEQTQDPAIVALALTASTAPVFLFSFVGGSLADLCDRRSVQLTAQLWTAGAIMLLAVLAVAGLASPAMVLALTFAVGVGTAIRVPTWQAAIADYVPNETLPAAVTLNSVAFNVSRSIGPVVGGTLVAAFTAVGAFLYSAVSSLVLVVALYRLPRSSTVSTTKWVPELYSTLRSGIAYVASTPAMHAILYRTVLVCVPAAATLALLPVIVKQQLEGGPFIYGFLLGCFGLGAVLGAALLPAWRSRRPSDSVLGGAMFIYSVALFILAFSPRVPAAALALIFSGAAWVAMLSTLNTAVYAVIDSRMRGRALSAYLTCSYGAISLGSLIWGKLASVAGLEISLMVAGGLLTSFIPIKIAGRLPDYPKVSTVLTSPGSGSLDVGKELGK